VNLLSPLGLFLISGVGMQVKTYGLIEKAAKLKEGEVEFVVSTDSWDAHGERMNVDGIDLKDFKKNPVVLWAHDGFNLPIAKATKIWKEGNKLMARATFKINDEFPRKVYEYIVEGYLNAVSIGGMVEEWGHDGLTIARLKMKEFSVVSVPANQDALVAAKSFDGSQKAELNGLARMYARKCLEQDSNELHDTIKVLKTLTASLEEVALSEPPEDRASNVHVVLRQAQAVDHQVEKVIKVVKKGLSHE
jgi:HK97 family phage prohead protease